MGAAPGIRFTASNGRFIGWAGLALVAVGAVATLADGWHDSDPTVLAFLLAGAAALWVVVLRPYAAVVDDRLELHHPFHVVKVPLAAITDVEVRMTMLVHTVHGRLTFSPISRTRKALVKGGAPDPLNNYQDLVEERINGLARDARELGGDEGRIARAAAPLPIALVLGLLAFAVLLQLLG